MWPVKNLIEDKDMIREIEEKIIPGLSSEAEKIDPSDTGLIALDWLNGRRTPYADQKLKGAVAGAVAWNGCPEDIPGTCRSNSIRF